MNTPSETLRTDRRPSHEQITTRAELLWNHEGFPSGRDEQIWLEAERQLVEEAAEMALLTAAAQNRRTAAGTPDQPAGQPNAKRAGAEPNKKRAAGRG